MVMNRRKMKLISALGIAIVILVLILTSYYVNSRYQIEVISSQEEHNNININVNNKNVEFHDGFSNGSLNTQRWQITREGDFKESVIDVYDADPTGNDDYRLRLRANTIGTKDDTVKFHGVRSVESVNFSAGKELSFDLDWNNQSNGCYLTASLYLCPTVTTGNPGEEKDWLKFEYVGVPPGRNARGVIATKIAGVVMYLYTEDWPEQRTGRHIAYQRIKIILDNENESLKIVENGKEIYCSPSHGLQFSSAYIYLQMSSHSNYPARELYFDNVIVAAC
jgi:hypothetical protein